MSKTTDNNINVRLIEKISAVEENTISSFQTLKRFY